MGSWGSWLQQSGAGSGAGYSSTLAAFASHAQAQSSAAQESSPLGQEYLSVLQTMADYSAGGGELAMGQLAGGLRATYVLRHWHTLSCLHATLTLPLASAGRWTQSTPSTRTS